MRDAKASAPDISFTATVRAGRMRWNQHPDTDVTFSGTRAHTLSTSERENLPDHVRAGETYRHVRVDYRLECALPDEVSDPE